MPWRLARYLLRQTLAMYLLGVAAFCLLISIDFLALWAEYLIEHQASLGTVARLVLYRLPWFLHLSLPVAVVLAVLLVTGRMARDSELKAAYALGVRPNMLLGPLLVFGLLVSAVSIVNNGYLEPEGERRYNRLLETFFYTRPPNAVQSNAAFALPSGDIYYASRIRSMPGTSDSAELTGVLVRRDDGSTLTAPRGIWDSEARLWTLQDAQERPVEGQPRLVGDVTLPFDLEAQASQSLSRRETLSLTTLHQQIIAVRSAGGNVRELSFAFHQRLADAFSATVFVLFAGTLGLGLHGRSAGFAWTIVLLVSFWTLWTLSGNLFESGVLGPREAAWLTPAAVGAAGAAVAGWRLRT